jgi:hypothetical protein
MGVNGATAQALVRAAAAVGAVLLSACATVPVRPTPAMLRVIAEPENTAVYVNDQFVGSARVLSQRPKAMKPGVKFVTFQAADFFPHDVRLELPPGETTVRIKLRPIPP